MRNPSYQAPNAGRRQSPRTAIVALAVLACFAPAPAAAAPEFVAQPSDIYEQFTALKEPRADVPVGALWVQDYGPHGDGAAPDNLLTVRSLTGVTLSGDLQLRLTLGLAALLNLDPGYSRRISARFSDLSIVRVKDMAKLAGPAGEPRIYEALKAGTISISTDRDIGLDVGGALSVSKLPVVARADTGGKKSFTIDGRDLFIAYNVAASLASRTEWQDIAVAHGREPSELTLRGYRLRLRLASREAPPPAGAAMAGAACSDAVQVSLLRSSGAGEDIVPPVIHDLAAAADSLTIPLPLPVADGEGGILTSIVLRRADRRPAERTARPAGECPARDLRIAARLEGQRLKRREDPKAPGW